MAQTQIADVIVPAEFTAYQVEIEGIFGIEIRAADAGLNECGDILQCLGEASYTLRQQENDYKRRRTLHVLAL